MGVLTKVETFLPKNFITLYCVEYKKTLLFDINTNSNACLNTFISYFNIIITRIYCMSIRIFCLKKCLKKCLIKTLIAIEITRIFKICIIVDNGVLTGVGNFFMNFFK